MKTNLEERSYYEKDPAHRPRSSYADLAQRFRYVEYRQKSASRGSQYFDYPNWATPCILCSEELEAEHTSSRTQANLDPLSSSASICISNSSNRFF
jgi:hypothetical protein